MTPKTHQALEDSIKHWKRVVADPLGEPTGEKACALCQTYARECGCQDCPVMQRTGKSSCLETPFGKFRDAKADALHIDSSTSSVAERLDQLSKLAEEELQFLISLREETPTMPHSCVEFDLVLYIEDSSAKQRELLEAIALPSLDSRRIVGKARVARRLGEKYRIRVTLAQFAILLIKRDELELKNRFKELNVKRVLQCDGVLDLTHYEESSHDS